MAAVQHPSTLDVAVPWIHIPAVNRGISSGQGRQNLRRRLLAFDADPRMLAAPPSLPLRSAVMMREKGPGEGLRSGLPAILATDRGSAGKALECCRGSCRIYNGQTTAGAEGRRTWSSVSGGCDSSTSLLGQLLGPSHTSVWLRTRDTPAGPALKVKSSRRSTRGEESSRSSS